MFWKLPPKGIPESRTDVKNSSALAKIEKSKLFISESRFAYSVDDIIKFFEQGDLRGFKSSKMAMDQMTGVLKDFHNRNVNSSVNINLFTQKDIENLLEFPDFQRAFEKDPNFEAKQKYAADILPDTLQLLEQISQYIAKDDETTGSEMISGPIHDLCLLLTRDIMDFPEAEHGARSKEREALTNLTEFDFLNENGLTPYGFDRKKNLISDVVSIVHEGACPKGFSKQVANLYSLVMTHKNYHEAKETVSQRASVPQNINP